MPSSRYDLIPTVLDIVRIYDPKSILDVGIGYGKFGALFREYLDVWKTDKPIYERTFKLTGVEVFEKYRNPIWELYDKIFNYDILTLLPILKGEKFDLLFMGDVIEHFTKDEGKHLLAELQYDKLIVITPRAVSPQGEVYGNKYETHKSQWDENDFPGMNHKEINNQQIFWN